jgi:zinc protease
MKQIIIDKKTYSIGTIDTGKAGVTQAYITVDCHSRDGATTKAIQLLYKDLITAGCTGLSRTEFQNKVDALGADISFSISNDVLTISVSSLSANFKPVITLLQKTMVSPTFTARELRRAKETLQNQLTEAKEDSKNACLRNFKSALFLPSDRRSSPTIDETISVIHDVNRSDLNRFNQTTRSSYLTCSISGTTQNCKDFAKVIESIQTVAERPHETHSHIQVRPKRLVLEDIPSKQNIEFAIGSTLSITAHDEDFIALTLGLAVLGKWGGFTGRLMSTVREKEGLTYGIYAKTEGAFADETGYWRVMTFFSPEKSIEGLSSTFRELNKLVQKGITTEELRRFKVILGTQQSLLQDSPLDQLKFLHNLQKQNMTPADALNQQEMLQQLTKKQVNQAIKKYIDPDALTISAAGPVHTVKKEMHTFAKTV